MSHKVSFSYVDPYMPNRLLEAINPDNTELYSVILNADLTDPCVFPHSLTVDLSSRGMVRTWISPFDFNSPSEAKIFARPLKFHEVKLVKGIKSDLGSVRDLAREFIGNGYRVVKFGAKWDTDRPEDGYARLEVRGNGLIEIYGDRKQMFVDLVDKLLKKHL